MKITTFNPMILSKNADAVIALFEELGFKHNHQGFCTYEIQTFDKIATCS